MSKEHNFEKLQSSDLIILNDYNNPVYSPEGSVQFSNIKGSKFKFGIFQLRNFREEIEIHLEYSHFRVGVPKGEFQTLQFECWSAYGNQNQRKTRSFAEQW